MHGMAHLDNPPKARLLIEVSKAIPPPSGDLPPCACDHALPARDGITRTLGSERCRRNLKVTGKIRSTTVGPAEPRRESDGIPSSGMSVAEPPTDLVLQNTSAVEV